MPGTYEIIAEELQADPAVRTGVMFGHRCLKTGRKMFACDYEGELLLKLPPDRLEELKREGARDFNPMGRRMNGWILVAEPDAVPALDAPAGRHSRHSRRARGRLRGDLDDRRPVRRRGLGQPGAAEDG